MKRVLRILVLLLAVCCNTKPTEVKSRIAKNMSEEYLKELDWWNEPTSFKTNKGTLIVEVTKGTDFFNNPEDSSIIESAPLLFKEIEGDFIANALVEPDFSSQWNAVSLMVHIDSLNWIKFAFENSDATGPSVVSVATKGISDDANGVVLNDSNSLWLAMAKKGNIFSMHWSLDGKVYKMARLTAMVPSEKVKIGLEFQSPVGDLAVHRVYSFEVLNESIKDLRNLNK